MALLHCNFFAHSIGKMCGLDVLVPEGKGRGPFPVLYLLHGLSDDQTAWQRRSNIERYVEGLGLIVAMPDGHRSFYVNGPAGTAALNYEDHIYKDVVGFMDNTFPTIRNRQGRALAGLSMGGFGAVMLALRHPNLFCAASSHSGAVAFGHNKDEVSGTYDYILGDRKIGGPYDCFALAEKLVGSKNRPAIRFDCGRKDFLFANNREFDKHLTALKYPHIYKEYPGAHTWEYWDQHIPESIEFIMKQMKR